jgi:hypothetical protein
MNSPLTTTERELMRESRGEVDFGFREITDDDVEKALRQYDNSEYARCLIESDPANEYARNILASLLDFCDKMRGRPIIKINGEVLDLDAIRHGAHKAAFSDAYAQMERGEL